MKYAIPEFSKDTIKCYKISKLRGKIKIYFVNKYMKKNITIPYTETNEKNLLKCMETQLDQYACNDGIETIEHAKYHLYSESREQLKTTENEEKTFNIKHLEVNANTIDKISMCKLENRIEVLKNYRNALVMLQKNGISLGKEKKLVK